MAEPWTALGVLILKDLVFKEVLLKLGKEALEDYVKDFFKDCIKEGVQSAKADVLKKALGEALQQFLRIVQDELEFECELSGAEIRDEYEIRIGKFLRDEEIKPLLGKAFEKDCRDIDANRLGAIWLQRYSPAMPLGFDWDRVANQYVKEVKRIIKKSPELRAVLELEIQESIEKKLKEIAGITPDFNLKKYQEGLLERYGNLKLDSLDTTSPAYNELKLWRIFIPQNVRLVHEILPQLHEIPKEHQRRLRESNQLEAEIDAEALERYKQIYNQQPIRSVGEIIKEKENYRYVVILGDPGSGKSTLLQYLALDWANSSPETAISQPIPLLIELRTYMRNRDSGQCKNFLGFFHHSSGAICNLNQHQLHEQLKAGNALVMFDGLDEVFDPGKREDVITDIHRFTNDYPNVRVIVTSGVIGYKPQRLRDAQFHHFMLQDLDEEQIKDFVNRWHDLTFNKNDPDKPRKRERLQRAIDTSKAIGELAGNPLLLTMMAILNRNQELPRDRPELYNQASRVLLHQWDVERALVEHEQLEIKTIDYKDKQAMLRQVAYHMQANEKGLAGNLISANDLEKILTEYLKTLDTNNPRAVARLMIDQLRTRNFILCFLGADYYAFVHRTFLEYFCAWEFVWQFEKERSLTLDDLKTEVFGKHWQDESWHEVLRLIAGMIDAKFVGEIIEYLMAQKIDKREFLDEGGQLTDEGVLNLLLAANCLAEVRNKTTIAPIATQLLEALKKEVEEEYPYEFDPKAAAAIVTAIATVWQDALETLNWLKSCIQLDSSSSVPPFAVYAIAQNWKDHPDTLPMLKQCATSGDNSSVRYAAVQELAQGWKDHPDTLPILKQRATSDDHWTVRQAAVRELAKGWKDHPDTLPMLKQRATSDDDSSVREAAVQELAQGWKDDPDTLPILKQRATSDDNWAVRYAAVQELAKGWKDDPDTLPILKQRATSDDHWFVRYVAVQELAKGWKDEPGMFELLCDRTLNDPFERQEDWEDNPRQTALEAIIKQRPDSPQTLSLLRDRADNDSDEKLRKFAKKKLEKWNRN